MGAWLLALAKSVYYNQECFFLYIIIGTVYLK